VFCTAHECRPGEDPPPIGRAVPGYRVSVLDPTGSGPVAPGTVGEICVGGPGLADGYLGDPAGTARSFTPADVAGEPGARWYRTGDLGRERPDGALEYHGRRDGQVKIRGIRVELAEADALLAAAPGVREAACVARDGQLIGFTVGAPVRPAQLRHRAPGYLTPQQIHAVAALPRTASGKVDRLALAALAARYADDRPPAATPAGRVPDDPLATLLATATEVLGVAVPAGVPFVDVGDSLAAMRIGVRLHAAGWQLEATRLLGGATPAAAAARMRRVAAPPGRDAPPGPLSPSQQAIWYSQSRHPGSSAYTVVTRVRVDAVLDAGRLRRALLAVLARHPVLGCRIVGSRMAAGGEQADVEVLDVADDRMADELATLEEQTPVDPAREPPLRLALLRLPGRSELLLAVHHVVCDGPALDVLLADLAAGYRDRLGPAPADFRRYAAGAVEPSAQRVAEAAGALRGWPDIVALRDGAARPRLRPATVLRDLDPALVGGLSRLARQRHTTLYSVLLTGFGQALAAITGQPRLLVGTVTSTRPRPELERSVGQFTNLVPVALDLRGTDPVGDSSAALVTALSFADVPFHRLVAATGAHHDPPLVQVIFEYTAREPAPLDFGGVRGAPDPGLAGQGAVCDLYLRMVPVRGGLRCVCVRDASVVSAATVDRLLDRAEEGWRLLAARSAT
jgi:hypothetical protein